MKGAGIGLIIFGPLLMMGALIYQPTVSTSGIYGLSEETYNLGKLQYQALFFQAGIGAFIAGVILAATGELLAPRRLRCDSTFAVRAGSASGIRCRSDLRMVLSGGPCPLQTVRRPE
ncbi:hypothetical protein [Allosphingosinicella sp.]|uniref:hypothetical protein n=1 Tax=Allosphingosinicella sp. TaxID=2823234 RepID=UPI002FC1C634